MALGKAASNWITQQKRDSKSFSKKTGLIDMGAYGANILFEISKILGWFCQNYYLETRSFYYDALGKTELQLEQSRMLSLIWNWNPVSSSIKLPVEFIRLEDLEGWKKVSIINVNFLESIFLHLQLFIAYGLGLENLQISHTARDGNQRFFPEKEGITDIGIYGVNLII